MPSAAEASRVLSSGALLAVPSVQIYRFPVGVKRIDEVFLFRTSPVFDLLFSRNSLVSIGANFEINKQVTLVATCEFFGFA